MAKVWVEGRGWVDEEVARKSAQDQANQLAVQVANYTRTPSMKQPSSGDAQPTVEQANARLQKMLNGTDTTGSWSMGDEGRPVLQMTGTRPAQQGMTYEDQLNKQWQYDQYQLYHNAQARELNDILTNPSAGYAQRAAAFEAMKRLNTPEGMSLDDQLKRAQIGKYTAEAQDKLQEAIESRANGGRGKAPANYRWTANGDLEAIPGGAADIKAQGKFNQDMASFNGADAGLTDLATVANQVMNHPGMDAGTGWQTIFPTMPGSDAANFEEALNTLKSKTAFGTLQAMRDASKTGGALGAVSEKELKLLESALAPLGTKQSPEQFKQSMQAIIDNAQAAKGRLRNSFNMIHNQGGSQNSTAQKDAPTRMRAISEAKWAISNGANPEAVRARLASMGITDSGV